VLISMFDSSVWCTALVAISISRFALLGVERPSSVMRGHVVDFGDLVSQSSQSLVCDFFSRVEPHQDVFQRDLLESRKAGWSSRCRRPSRQQMS